MNHQVTTTHLIMGSPDQLRGRTVENRDVSVLRLDPPNPQLNHACFMEIGTPYRWYSRLSWNADDWTRYANDPTVETWIGTLGGNPFGYFELKQHAASESGGLSPVTTEIMFLGVFPAFGGRGLGGHLLTSAVRSAWKIAGTERVSVHTCTSDHPAARANYLARGFTVEREITETETLPDPEDPLWCSPAYYRSLGNR